jgi:hypothetical protein
MAPGDSSGAIYLGAEAVVNHRTRKRDDLYWLSCIGSGVLKEYH